MPHRLAVRVARVATGAPVAYVERQPRNVAIYVDATLTGPEALDAIHDLLTDYELAALHHHNPRVLSALDDDALVTPSAVGE